jgi:hypothetical protein
MGLKDALAELNLSPAQEEQAYINALLLITFLEKSA